MFRCPLIKGFEVDDDFAVDVGVKLDDLALREEVQLIFTCGEASRRSISRLSSPSPSSNRQIMTICSQITMIFLSGGG